MFVTAVGLVLFTLISIQFFRIVSENVAMARTLGGVEHAAPGWRRRLLAALRAGNAIVANAIGTGIADDKAVYAYTPDMIRYYLAEDMILPNVPTYVPVRPADRQYVLDHLDELVAGEIGQVVERLDAFLADRRQQRERRTELAGEVMHAEVRAGAMTRTPRPSCSIARTGRPRTTRSPSAAQRGHAAQRGDVHRVRAG